MLEIAALRGFNQEYVDFLKQGACWGGPGIRVGALKQRRQVAVKDVNTDASYAPLREAAAQAGYRSVLATPLFDLTNEPLGNSLGPFPLPAPARIARHAHD